MGFENPKSAFASMLPNRLAEFGIETINEPVIITEGEQLTNGIELKVLDFRESSLQPGQKYGEAVSGESSGK